MAAVLLEMGLGKSVITLTAIFELLYNRFEVGKVLVIAPLRVAKVSPQLLERYAMCSARWIQCEEMTNKLGFLSKHPTTQKPIPSPFINIGINYWD